MDGLRCCWWTSPKIEMTRSSKKLSFANVIQNKLQPTCYSVNIVKFLTKAFFYRTPPVTASEQYSHLWRSSNKVKKLTLNWNKFSLPLNKKDKVSSQTSYPSRCALQSHLFLKIHKGTLPQIVTCYQLIISNAAMFLVKRLPN